MVEFCNACGTSLPTGDLTFKEGKSYTSHDYTCPKCNQNANPSTEPDLPEPDDTNDLVIKSGEVKSEAPKK